MSGAAIPLSKLRQWLTYSTAIYLSLPVAIFVVCWLRPVYAAGGVMLLVLAVAQYLRHLGPGRDSPGEPVIPLLPCLWLIGLASLPLLLSGSGGIGPQTWDWQKHNAILSDLINSPWPVVYQTTEDAVALVYYVAYYLPAALAGKLLGWTAANLVLWFTTWAGTILALLWLCLFAGRAVWWLPLVLIFFSGMDIVGALATMPLVEIVEMFRLGRQDWWLEYWQYSGNFSAVLNVPHQALAAWLCTALSIDAICNERKRFPWLLMVAVVSLWSPFAAVGLLPLAGYYLYRATLEQGVSAHLSFANLAGLLLCAVLLLFYVSRYLPYDLPAAYTAADASPFAGDFDLIWNQGVSGNIAWNYGVFVVCEFLLLVFLLYPGLKTNRLGPLRIPLLISAVVLMVLPNFHYGIYNDLVMRSSLPALFVLQICAVSVLATGKSRKIKLTLVLVLALGGLSTAGFLASQAVHGYREGIVSLRPRYRVHTVLHLPVCSWMKPAFHKQYLGSVRSPFFEWLSPVPQSIYVPDPITPP